MQYTFTAHQRTCGNFSQQVGLLLAFCCRSFLDIKEYLGSMGSLPWVQNRNSTHWLPAGGAFVKGCTR